MIEAPDLDIARKTALLYTQKTKIDEPKNIF